MSVVKPLMFKKLFSCVQIYTLFSDIFFAVKNDILAESLAIHVKCEFFLYFDMLIKFAVSTKDVQHRW
jgi:hypothetical protein